MHFKSNCIVRLKALILMPGHTFTLVEDALYCSSYNLCTIVVGMGCERKSHEGKKEKFLMSWLKDVPYSVD